jgi:hypothetical protein
MQSPKEVVLAYVEATGAGDFTTARKLLNDNLEFRGPFDTFHKADDLVHALEKLHAIVERIDVKKVFEDGNEVGVFCDLVTKPLGPSFVAEWYQVKGGKIASIRIVFDARPFAAMFSKPAG